eukprot:Clim_evm11s100 gene=Clim_evmTU11s100
MSFKQIILTGLVAAVAANPAPRAKELARSMLDQRLQAITGMSPIASVVGGEAQDVFIGTQKTYYCGDKATYISEQGLECAIYYIKPDGNHQMMYVERNALNVQGTLTSGDNEWVLPPNHNGVDLHWNSMDPMNINEENTFNLTLTGEGDVDSGAPGITVTDHSYLGSIVAGKNYGADDRAAGYFFGPVAYDNNYDIICVYAAIPQCD